MASKVGKHFSLRDSSGVGGVVWQTQEWLGVVEHKL
jgi:hypothetical protein